MNLYDGLVIAPGAVVNGNLTVSENVADIGAIACILDIAEDIPDADYKALFESLATIWRFTGTRQMYLLLATQDVHAPHKYRVNRVLQNFPSSMRHIISSPGMPCTLRPSTGSPYGKLTDENRCKSETLPRLVARQGFK